MSSLNKTMQYVTQLTRPSNRGQKTFLIFLHGYHLNKIKVNLSKTLHPPLQTISTILFWTVLVLLVIIIVSHYNVVKGYVNVLDFSSSIRG